MPATAYTKALPRVMRRAQTCLSKTVRDLTPLALFADWPTQQLGFLARWVRTITLKNKVRSHARASVCTLELALLTTATGPR